MPTPIPAPAQLEFLDWELGLFLHFGIRTFYEGHRDWDGREMGPACFNPVGLDCDQWMAIAREAGVRYAVMTAKHHDGFALWPSKYTDFSVAGSPWQGGQGDVVREFVKAARRHDIAPGLYYSPAQWGSHGVEMSDPAAYDDYFVNQLTELLTGYGELRVLWLDGCGSSEHDYDWRRIFGEIRRLQPTVMVAHLGDPDFGWIGNECGIAPRPVWNAVEAIPFQNAKTVIRGESEPRFLPMECDCMMRDHNWFFEQGDRFAVKSLAELMGMYDYSVGRGSNLLINIGPDRRGLLPDGDADSLLAFGRTVKQRFAHPLATLADFEGGTVDERPAWTFEPEAPETVNTVVLQEDLTAGQHIRRFAVRGEVYLHGQKPITLWEGTNPGHKAICSFPLIRLRKLWVEILDSDGEPRVRELAAYRA